MAVTVTMPQLGETVTEGTILSWAKAVGDTIAEDEVRVRLPYREAVTTIGDTVHGGAIAGLVDTTATACFWASPQIPAGSRGTTIGLNVNFLSAGRGLDLVAHARVRRRGREVSTAEVSVRDPDGREVAVALVTYKLSPPR